MSLRSGISAGDDKSLGPVSGQPTDWTMPITYKSVISTPDTTSPITSGPYNMAFDANGNAWIGDRVNGVVEIGPRARYRRIRTASTVSRW